MAKFIIDTATSASSSYRTALLLDVELTRFGGISGEAKAEMMNHTLSVSRVPGSSMFAVNSDKIRLAAWDSPVASFTPAGSVLYTLPTRSFDLINVGIPPHWFERAQAGTSFDNVDYQFFQSSADHVMIYSAKLLGALAFGMEPVDDPMLVETLVMRLVSRIISQLSGLKRQTDQAPAPPMAAITLLRVTSFVDHNLHRVIRLKEMADVAGMSLYHFSRSFRSTVSATPMYFVTVRRIDRSKRMLRTGTEPIAAVALICGFSSQAHFTTVFREMEGMTPAKYRGTSTAA